MSKKKCPICKKVLPIQSWASCNDCDDEYKKRRSKMYMVKNRDKIRAWRKEHARKRKEALATGKRSSIAFSQHGSGAKRQTNWDLQLVILAGYVDTIKNYNVDISSPDSISPQDISKSIATLSAMRATCFTMASLLLMHPISKRITAKKWSKSSKE